MTPSHRNVITDLASDLAWLEDHARKSSKYAEQAVLLRFAAGLVRNQIGPYMDGLRPPPLHLAVVGGAGSGKSTVANLLIGMNVAEANPQAGYTRHPIAYTMKDTPTWFNHEGLLHALRRLDARSPSNLDEDVYQVHQLDGEVESRLLPDFVIWDCPDMTTWAASGYAPRLLEVAALADVIVYVASDERYNDAVPTQYLRLLLQAGKPVVVVLTKMKPTQVADLIAHFKKEVVEELPKGRLAIFAVPHLTPEELAEPIAKAATHRIPLVNQVAVLGQHREKLRQDDVTSALGFLQASQNDLVAAARDDVQALQQWQQLVIRGESEFNDRYRREFLTGAKFHRFDEALVRLIDLLELPGVGKFFANALYVVRTPYRLVKGFLGKMLGPPDAPTIPEQPVLESAFSAWTDQIRATALAQQKQHDLWYQVARGFEAQLGGQLREKFETGLRDFQAGQREEIDATARAIYEDLEKSPNTLAALRGSKLALDVAAITGGIVMGGIGWTDLIIVPLAASVSQQLVEWLGAGYVELQRDNARQRQMDLMAKVISRPIGEWLVKWPTTGGTQIERMQLAVSRVPQSLHQLQEMLRGGSL